MAQKNVIVMPENATEEDVQKAVANHLAETRNAMVGVAKQIYDGVASGTIKCFVCAFVGEDNMIYSAVSNDIPMPVRLGLLEIAKADMLAAAAGKVATAETIEEAHATAKDGQGN